MRLCQHDSSSLPSRSEAVNEAHQTGQLQVNEATMGSATVAVTKCLGSSINHHADCGRIAMRTCWTCNVTSGIGVQVSVQDCEKRCKHDSRCAGGTHLYSALCQTVQAACCLIQQQHPRILQDGPSKCHPLLLTCHIAIASAKLIRNLCATLWNAANMVLQGVQVHQH